MCEIKFMRREGQRKLNSLVKIKTLLVEYVYVYIVICN